MAVDAKNPLLVYFLVYSARVLSVLNQAIEEAKAERREKVAVVSLPVLGAFPELGLLRHTAGLQPVFYVNDPVRNMEMLCIGAEATREIHGEDAIGQAHLAFWEDLAAQTGDRMVSPVFYGGFAFAPGARREGMWANWPDGLWIWPRWQWIKEGGQVYLLVSRKVTADSDAETIYRQLQEDLRTVTREEGVGHAISPEPPMPREESSSPEEWKAAVERTLNDIRAGEFEKVVLARKMALHAGQAFDTIHALHVLKTNNPTSVAFYLNYADQVFLGATPERLVETYKGQVYIDCLAGTAPRGKSAADDERLGAALLESGKDLVEHKFVRAGIENAVGSVVELVAPDQPVLRKFTHVQHLYTPLRGHLAEGSSLFDLVEKLHPTPAVAGVPKELVKKVILDREGMDRGYYAGPLGWMDREGNGSFVVALRSGLVAGANAEIFAGAGIVNDSHAEQEWLETDWKLAPMKTALGLLPQ